jgi:hypothetical protein
MEHVMCGNQHIEDTLIHILYICLQGDLLDCSGSSEDVFGAPSCGGRRKPISKCYNVSVPQQSVACGSIVGVDAASAGISRFVRVVTASEISPGTQCPICLQDMNPGSPMVVALTHCLHQLHLDCLNSMLSSQPSTNKVSTVKVERVFHF